MPSFFAWKPGIQGRHSRRYKFPGFISDTSLTNSLGKGHLPFRRQCAQCSFPNQNHHAKSISRRLAGLISTGFPGPANISPGCLDSVLIVFLSPLRGKRVIIKSQYSSLFKVFPFIIILLSECSLFFNRETIPMCFKIQISSQGPCDPFYFCFEFKLPNFNAQDAGSYCPEMTSFYTGILFCPGPVMDSLTIWISP